MITFTTPSNRLEGDKLIVFFAFSNGEVNTERFPLTATILEIQEWGNARAKWFEEREEEIKKMQEEVSLINSSTEITPE